MLYQIEQLKTDEQQKNKKQICHETKPPLNKHQFALTRGCYNIIEQLKLDEQLNSVVPEKDHTSLRDTNIS